MRGVMRNPLSQLSFCKKLWRTHEHTSHADSAREMLRM